jgi:Protein of unknown function (DUF3611)
MQDRSEPLPTSLRQIALTFRLSGWISFWTQLVLAVFSLLALALAAISPRPTATPNNPATTNPGTGFGIFLAGCGLVILLGSIYLAFRYTRIARQLQSPNASVRPRKADTIKVLRLGLLVSLGGMLVTLFGAYAIVGTLVGKSISGQALTTPFLDPSRIISGSDMFGVQSNLNTLGGHFVGIVSSLWLLNRIERK